MYDVWEGKIRRVSSYSVLNSTGAVGHFTIFVAPFDEF